MAVENHPSSSTAKKRSKAEMKMFLVAQRLAMLQTNDDDNDDDDDDSLPEEVENPMQCELYEQKMVVNDDEWLEDRPLVIKVESKKKRSLEKRIVIGDGESSEDSGFIVELVPRKRKRATENTNKNKGLDYKASKNPRKRRTASIDDFEVKSTLARAEEVKDNLSGEYPCFVKLMLRSHVTQGFWLGLPTKFCSCNLPTYDCTMVLVDEDGRECETKFLAQKCGLSAGWRGFSIEHNLQEGDVVIFQLIEPTIFKIYVVRADSLGEVDGTVSLLNLDASIGQCISEPEKVNAKEDNPLLLLEENAQGNSDIDTECEVIDGLSFSDAIITFESIKTFKNFNIVVYGLVIDSKFSEDSRKKYYELCSNQGAFLHENLLQGLNSNLVIGIISEIINIADGIKACKASSTSHNDLQVWEKTLKGFTLWGMNVGFLVDQVRLLLGVNSEFDNIDESAQTRAFERRRDIENKLLELKKNMKETELELTADLNASAQKREVRMKEILANA